MKFLVTGANGQVGQCLQDNAADVEIIALDRSGLDITDAAQVKAVLHREQPDAVINAAAYTAVDKAEEDADAALAANVTGPANLAGVCAELKIPFLHISTDYVFDGSATRAYQETDEVSPLGAYGRTKWQGEQAVRERCDKHVILRTAWVFSEYGRNFVKTMLRLSAGRDQLKVVNDQVGCPTYAGDIASALLILAKRAVSGEPVWGTYHYCGDVAVSWWELARQTAAHVHKAGVVENIPEIMGIPTEEYPTPAQRPAFSVLDTAKIESLGIAPSPWYQRLQQVIEKLSIQP